MEQLLTNSNKKWIGTLDTDAWTLSFVQIVPEKKELPTLRLKQVGDDTVANNTPLLDYNSETM